MPGSAPVTRTFAFIMTKLTPMLAIACFLGACVAFGGSVGCKRNVPPKATPEQPTLRIYAISSLSGALEPCGCVKDMLGGIDHAAKLIESTRGKASSTLLVAAGPLWFLNPELADERKTQDLWKAEALADSLKDMGLAAWAPGANDFAAGLPMLKELTQRSGARMLAANLKADSASAAATSVVERGKIKVGLAGISLLSGVEQITAGDPAAAMRAAYDELQGEQAQIKVALIAADRGEALRLVEAQPGFDLVLLGKPSDEGDGNDAAVAPILIGDTLVVQGPNHLQSVVMVDLYVSGDPAHGFKDGSGIERAEQRASLERRITELQGRIKQWQAKGDVKQEDIAARQRDLEKMQSELGQLSAPVQAPDGNFFRYESTQVREKLGVDVQVAARIGSYYKRVNDHNKEAFKDRRPEPAPAGEASYVGMDECSDCHPEASEFWTKTGHAKAYKTLADEFKEFNLDCVSCHVTGYDQPGGSTVTFVDNLKDVQCEVCHGPGSRHVDDSEAKGLIQLTPDKSLCSKCHHPPHVMADWDVEQAWPHIVGPGHGQPLAANDKAPAPEH